MKNVKKLLGLGYSSGKSMVTGRVVDIENISDEALISSGETGFIVFHEDATVDSCNKVIGNKFEATLGIPLFGGLNFSATRVAQDSALESHEARFCMVAKCSYQGWQFLARPEFNPQACLSEGEKGNHQYIHSCVEVKGYLIVMSFHSEKHEMKEGEKKHGFTLGNVSQKFGMEIKHTSGSQQNTANWQNTKIEIQWIGIKPQTLTFKDKSLDSIIIELDRILEQSEQSPGAPYFNVERDVFFRPDYSKTHLRNLTPAKPLPPRREKYPDEGEIKKLMLPIEQGFTAKYKEVLSVIEPQSQTVRKLDPAWMLYNLLKLRLAIPEALKPSIIVVGKTGAGKSTLICHALDVPLKKKRSTGGYIAEVEPAFKADYKYPAFGNKIDSMTQLPEAYLPPALPGISLLDSAGFFDTRGYEIDIVNQIGLQVAAERMKIAAGVVFVIPLSAFDARIDGLREFVPHFMQMLRNPKAAIIQGSILFSVSNTGPHSSEDVKSDIKVTLEEWFKSIMAKKKESATWTGWIKNKVNATASDEDRDGELCEMVSLMLSNFDRNFIVPDVYKKSKDLTARLSELSPIVSRDIQFDNHQDGKTKVKYLLLSIMTHANAKQLQLKISAEKISSEEDLIKRLENPNPDADEAALKKKRADLKEIIGEDKGDGKTEGGKINATKIEISNLQNSKEQKYLTTWDKSRKRGFFEWGKGPEISQGADNGCYSDDAELSIDKKHAHAEQYSVKDKHYYASFRPDWCGHESKLNLRITVPTKDHPDTATTIKTKEKEITGLKADAERLQREIDTLETSRKSTKIQNEEAKKRHQSLLDDYKKEHLQLIREFNGYLPIYTLVRDLLDVREFGFDFAEEGARNVYQPFMQLVPSAPGIASSSSSSSSAATLEGTHRTFIGEGTQNAATPLQNPYAGGTYAAKPC